MTTDEPTVLAARGLVYRYPGGAAGLDGLDLDVRGGERLAILGANGAGKSTLLAHLNGGLRPGGGVVEIDGAAVGYDRRALRLWRRRVGLVLQNPDDQLFAGSVSEDVSFGPLNLGLPEAEVRDRVARALADLGIEALADRAIHALSLGEKRRVAIAGVVAMDPGVLLLDEPAAGLDPDGVTRLVATLAHLRAGGAAIVYSTHDVDLAARFSDRVAVFASGRTIGCGPTAAVLADGALLARAGLRAPTTIVVADAARRLGLIEAGAPPPLTVDALVAQLAEGAGAPSAGGAARGCD